MSNKITLSELRKIIKQVISEGPYDDIDFGFLDQEDEIKKEIRKNASEGLYNKMVKDLEILKEIYNLYLSSENKEKAFYKFTGSQLMNRVERYMDDVYNISELRKISGEQEILNLCESTFKKFFDNAYEAAKKRHERSQNDDTN